MLRFAGAIAVALTLGACSSLGLSPAGNAIRGLDYANDDIAGALIAFDLPETLEPMEEGPAVRFDIVSAGGERHIRAVLERSDAGELAGTLPPPNDGRLYYLFGFSVADQQKIRETQAWAKSLPQGQGGALTIGIEPRFCANEAVDPARVRYSVLAALTGKGSVEPLVSNQPLSAALAAASSTLPACEGHSG